MDDWYPVDLPQAPSGEGLEHRWESFTFQAWEDEDGTWLVIPIHDSGETDYPASRDSFEEVQKAIEEFKICMTSKTKKLKKKLLR